MLMIAIQFQSKGTMCNMVPFGGCFGGVRFLIVQVYPKGAMSYIVPFGWPWMCGKQTVEGNFLYIHEYCEENIHTIQRTISYYLNMYK